MKPFLVYDKHGKILRSGICQDSTFYRQAHDGEFVMEGIADDTTQKIDNAGLKGKIINKTSEEIEAEKSKEKPCEKWPAHITNEQWQSVLKRLDKLEAR